MRAPPRALARAACRTRAPCPALGRSSPSTSRSSVVLPPPFGPAMATNSPGATASETSSRTRTPAAVAERDAVELDDGVAQLVHPSAFRSAARFARMTEK